MISRPPVEGTARVLTAGSVLSAGLLAASFVLTVAGLGELARWLSTAGVLALLATPAVSLVVSAIELRHDQRGASWLALGVLAVLGAASAIALLART